ncbi:MAG: hypothetical protein HRU34_05905 [Richelia sp.]|nr:hypothetical protein [Richelia sp.]
MRIREKTFLLGVAESGDDLTKFSKICQWFQTLANSSRSYGTPSFLLSIGRLTIFNPGDFKLGC